MKQAYPTLKKSLPFLLLLLTLVTSFHSVVQAQTNAGVYDSYIKLSGKKYYLGRSGTLPPLLNTNQLSKPTFNGTNLGTYLSTGTLNLNGVMAYTWKPTAGGGNICGVQNFYYAVFPIGGSPSYSSFPAYSQVGIGNIGSNFCQMWYDTAQSINLLSGLAPGLYQLQVYIDLTGSQTANDCASHILVDGLPGSAGAKYTAIFTVKGPKCPPGTAVGTELITNGDFSLGNTGFNTAYTYTTPTGTSQPNQYYIGTAAQVKTWNTPFVTSGGPAGVNDVYMAVDGNSPTTGMNVWSQTTKVSPSTIYVFSFYVCSFGGSSPSQLYFYANNIPFGISANAPSAANQWKKVTMNWCSGNDTSVTISIVDSNTVKIGNDFGIDSISLRSSSTYFHVFGGNDTTICSGSSVQLTATPGACAYKWTPAATLNNDSIPNPIASPTVTTFYQLIADVPGCKDAADTSVVVVTIGGSLPVSAGGPQYICTSGGSVTLNGTGATIYSWSPAIGLSNSTSATPIANPTVTTTYTLTASNATCSGTDTAVVYVGGFNPTVVPANATLCAGKSVQFNISGGTQYNWLPATGLTSATVSNPTASPTISTTYTVTITSPGGCTATRNVPVTVSPAYSAGIISTPQDTVCSGSPGSVVLTSSLGTPVQWQSSPSTSGFTDISGASTSTYIAPVTQTTYFRAIVGTGVCADTSTVQRIYVPPALTAIFTFTNSGPTVNFNSGGSTGTITVYFWDFGDGGTSNVPNPSHTYTKMDTVNVCLTIYDGSNCSFTYCTDVTFATGIEAVDAAAFFNIYPSPFNENIFIDAKQLNLRVESAEVYDVLGRKLIDKTVNGFDKPIVLNTSSLASGVYILKLKTNGKDYVTKVVKQ